MGSCKTNSIFYCDFKCWHFLLQGSVSLISRIANENSLVEEEKLLFFIAFDTKSEVIVGL